MITAVDTNILVDLLNPDEPFAATSERALLAARRSGSIILSEVVYAELAANFAGRKDLDEFLSDGQLRIEPSSEDALFRSGQAWADYSRRRPARLTCPECGSTSSIRCERCGRAIQPRQHIVADFIIGAHALEKADRLLTRDRGFYGMYFPDLVLA